MQRRTFLAALAALTCSLPLVTGAARADDGQQPTKHARILMVTQSAGFRHGAVTRRNDELAPAEKAITELGVASNLFRVDCTQDVAKDFTKENLQNYDIVFFYTTGNLPIKDEDLDYFINDWLKQKGKGFIGAHSATDTYHNDKRYYEMINGTFNGHPWGSGSTVTITVHDQDHPASKPWGSEFEIKDEIYRFKNFEPKNVRVLMSLNMAKTARKEPYHVPIAWVKEWGDGKVFYISLGHNEHVWEDERFLASVLGGVKWILNLEKGDATPNPDLSAAQEEKAKADAAAAKE